MNANVGNGSRLHWRRLWRVLLWLALFAVLMTTSGGIDHVANTAAEVKSVIEASVDIADVRVDITASVGISVTDPNGEGVDGSTMLRQADVAMYIAKGQHLGTVFYDRADDPYSPKRLSLAADLRHAVERGEIEAYFQPEIDLVTGDVISVEALARWTHPEHGNIVPDQFIPIAEQSGLIRDLTYLMLKQSLERIRQWRSHGFDLHVAVNLSVRCLSDEHLVERVMRQLELAGLGPDCLTLEVTEGTIMADPEHALAVLGRLHDQGIRLSIDDFGMGYSSLAQLKRMPVGQLKVDRSFVTYVSEDHDDAAIIAKRKGVPDQTKKVRIVEGQTTAVRLLTSGPFPPPVDQTVLRKQLEAKVAAGTASREDITTIRAICSYQGDKACVANMDARLRPAPSR